jgi:Holliday junction resolvasome RuvABC endonuclease subunit
MKLNAKVKPTESSKILYIGLDPSINSTGLVFRSDNYLAMYQITSGDSNCSTSVRNVSYERINTNTKRYSEDDLNKIVNAKRLSHVILKLINQNLELSETEYVILSMEGSVMSFGFKNSASRLNDLVLNNSIIKLALLQSNLITDFFVISPAALKKRFTGSGKAKKEDMMKKFKELVPTYDFSIGKNDDIADAYALSCNC